MFIRFFKKCKKVWKVERYVMSSLDVPKEFQCHFLVWTQPRSFTCGWKNTLKHPDPNFAIELYIRVVYACLCLPFPVGWSWQRGAGAHILRPYHNHWWHFFTLHSQHIKFASNLKHILLVVAAVRIIKNTRDWMFAGGVWLNLTTVRQAAKPSQSLLLSEWWGKPFKWSPYVNPLD